MLIVVEVGLITPPVGMNLFIINAMAKDTPIGQTYKGALPFVLTDMIRVVILAAFPAITLWLVWFIDSLSGSDDRRVIAVKPGHSSARLLRRARWLSEPFSVTSPLSKLGCSVITMIRRTRLADPVAAFAAAASFSATRRRGALSHPSCGGWSDKKHHRAKLRLIFAHDHSVADQTVHGIDQAGPHSAHSDPCAGVELEVLRHPPVKEKPFGKIIGVGRAQGIAHAVDSLLRQRLRRSWPDHHNSPA